MECKICHNEIGSSEICPHCGYGATAETGDTTFALLPGKAIGKRYVISNIIAKNENEIIYSAWDMKDRCTAAVKEFFPASLVSRQEDGSLAAIGNEEAAKYAEEYEKISDSYKASGEVISENYTLYLISKAQSNSKGAVSKATPKAPKKNTVAEKKKSGSKAPVVILSLLFILSLLAALAFAFLYFGGDEILGIGNFASEDEEGGENENADAENGDKKEETKEGENDKNEKPSKEENVSDQKGVSSYGETDFSLLLGEQHIACTICFQRYDRGRIL